MGALEKALSFVKKHWQTGDNVLPDDLNRYEDGIEDLYANKVSTEDVEQSIKGSIVNSLDSTETEKSLAAAQGKELLRQIKVLSGRNSIPSIDIEAIKRNVPTKPSDYSYELEVAGIKNASALGLTAGGFVHVIGFNGWTDSSADVHEIGFQGRKVIHRVNTLGVDAWEQWQTLATSDEITALSNVTLKKQDRTGIDLNTIFNTGTEGYCTGNCLNTPSGGGGYFKDFYSTYSNIGYQEFIIYNTGEKFKRYRIQNEWQPWTKLATTDKIDISFANGWTKTDSSTSAKVAINGTIVSCNVLLVTGNKADGTTICTNMPRPQGSFDFFLDTYNTTGVAIRSLFSYMTDGTIVCRGGTVGGYCQFNFSFSLI